MIKENYLKVNLKEDFLASIVVFLVAVPLCLGIAIASGLPAETGLISGIIGGVIVGCFSGAPLLVSGPAAGLVAIVYEIVQEHGLERLGAIIFFSGLIQILFGVLKLGPWFRAVSPAIVIGMLSGIGVLIFSNQFHVMVDDIPRSNAVSNILSLPSAVIKGITYSADTNHHIAALVGILTIIIMIIWKVAPKPLRIIPSALVGVIVSVIITEFFNLPIKHITVPDNFITLIKLPTLDSFKCLLDWEVLVESMTISFIASAETLLSAVAIDQVQTRYKTDHNKEIIAQGIGNSLCGLLGALPITGVIVRSSANVNAGAKTRGSTIIHGVWILIFISLFPHFLEKIPMASLGAVLVYTGYKLINVKAIKDLVKFGKSELLICLITIAVIVLDSLLEGIIVGIVLSVIKLLYNFSYIKISFEDLKDKVEVHIEGCATFINLPKLADELDRIPAGKDAYIYFTNLSYIDHACLDLLTNFQKQYESKGGQLTIKWSELENRFSTLKKTI